MIAAASYGVGDCFAARLSARTPTTAVGGLRNTNSGEKNGIKVIPWSLRLSFIILLGT
jgi:hypothetical protein